MKATAYLTSIAAALAFSGCEAPRQATPKTMSISVKVPVFQTAAETKEAQEKGGIEIAVVPALYKAVQKQRTTIEQAQQPGLSLLLVPAGDQNSKVYVEERITPYFETQPRRLQFSVRVNNKLSRVFRGQGAVVQFNVAGKLVPFGEADYKEFLNSIVPPRNEAEFTIYGPTLDALPENGTIGIFLYDVVTATDVAGNITEKQNFEWYFTYTNRIEQSTAPWTLKRGYMDANAFQQRKIREQIQTQTLH
ncbi:MAG TPA: hypothetical protein VFW05_00835 [Verrucomicrobiae bacterium]|nr:hypothetical protein [Verrucomicrobiae bacterium]